MTFDPLLWGTVSDWAIVATASVAAVAGVRQLWWIREANHQSAQFERANLLLSLDRDFEGDALLRARQRTLVVRNRIEQEVSDIDPPLAADRQKQEIAHRFSAYVTKVWQESRRFDGDADAERDSAANEYMTLMRLPYWCETLGHQSRRNLLPLDDILSLYDQLIIFVVGNLIEHIQLRSEHGAHRNSRYLENAVWLYDHAKIHKERLERPPAEPVNRSRLDWRR